MNPTRSKNKKTVILARLLYKRVYQILASLTFYVAEVKELGVNGLQLIIVLHIHGRMNTGKPIWLPAGFFRWIFR